MVRSVKSDSGRPYQCSMPRRPRRAAERMLDSATPICARCVVDPRWSLFASSRRGAGGAGGAVGLEDRVGAGEALQPVEPLLRRPLRELARLLGRVDWAAVPRAAGG